MAKEAKIKKPQPADVNFRGLMTVLQDFNTKMVMHGMLEDGDLDGWDDPANEGALTDAMTAETDLKRKAVYCAVLCNFVEAPEEEV